MIKHHVLTALLRYDRTTGLFFWRSKSVKNPVGVKAGARRDKIQINIQGKAYYAHRLAWFYVYKKWPKNQIDHINGNSLDNRIKNLRDLTTRENCSNKRVHRNGKLVGCYFDKWSGRWKAQIQVNGKIHHIGRYNTEKQAHAAYLLQLKGLKNAR